MDLFALGAHRRTIWAVLGEQCVCVCVEGGGGGGGKGGGGSYTYVLRNSLQIVFGWRVFLCLLLYTSMLIKHITTFNIPV